MELQGHLIFQVLYGDINEIIHTYNSYNDTNNIYNDISFHTYNDWIIAPALNNYSSTSTNYKVIHGMKDRYYKHKSHLVTQLPTKDASQLVARRMGLGFDHCFIEKFVNIVRFYNCLQVHHLALQCKLKLVRASWTGEHYADHFPVQQDGFCYWKCLDDLLSLSGIYSTTNVTFKCFSDDKNIPSFKIALKRTISVWTYSNELFSFHCIIQESS